jgi:hypothetical protein
MQIFITKMFTYAKSSHVTLCNICDPMTPNPWHTPQVSLLVTISGFRMHRHTPGRQRHSLNLTAGVL